MRRKDKEISAEEAFAILKEGEYGILSVVSQGNTPYGVPLNFCVIGRKIYFHCALDGRKLDILNKNNLVSFCVVGSTEVMPDKFGTKYESVILTGIAIEVFAETKRNGLEGLLQKYSSNYMESGFKYIDKLTDKTKVFEIEIQNISGKTQG
jgi:hypothetical protein